ncbi:MAG TPA: TetR/AcrR family transcriptional regulator [Xanthobacteraceae bacterium]|nr:TetR/AcrR family transcriptional regulator [Xanthobacteraceae bacterium]
MARRPSRAHSDTPTPPTGTERERIIAAFMALLAEKSFEQIELAEVAARAGVSLGAMRGEFGSTLAVYAAHVRAIDRAVLDGGEGDMTEEPPRERLFDVLMRRIEALAPHKEAIRSLLRSARRNPPLALALNALAVRSQQWMLTAADIHASGPRGALRAQGLALLWARVLRTFVNDEEEGHARTMAALDRALGRGARWVGFLDDLCRFVPGCRPRRRRRRDWDEEPDDEATVAA